MYGGNFPPMIPRQGMFKKPENQNAKTSQFQKSRSKPRIQIKSIQKVGQHFPDSTKSNTDSLYRNYGSRDSKQKMILEIYDNGGLDSMCCMDMKKCNFCPIF